jgi:hypothetical protein
MYHSSKIKKYFPKPETQKCAPFIAEYIKNRFSKFSKFSF